MGTQSYWTGINGGMRQECSGSSSKKPVFKLVTYRVDDKLENLTKDWLATSSSKLDWRSKLYYWYTDYICCNKCTEHK